MKEIGVGIIGFGTVGAGVVEGLRRNGALIAQRIGLRLAVRKIADIDLKSDRGVSVPKRILTREADEVIGDPSVDVIVELIGGTTVAKDVIMKALRARKPVVTANKSLLAEQGARVFAAAARNGTDVRFEASVGGAIPIIRALRQGLIANRIEGIRGILNGTCNYILTEMERHHLSFETALSLAQGAGFAEADPRLDVDGYDTAHKAVILASIACGAWLPMRSVYVEGIRHLTSADIRYAANLGYRIKLLAVIKFRGRAVEVRVHPTFLPVQNVLASVGGVYNAIMVSGDVSGDTVYYGRGAGRLPAASSVISDLSDAALALSQGSRHDSAAQFSRREPPVVRQIGDIKGRYYLRLSLLDRPGVLAQIANVLGCHNISIASAIQTEPPAGRHVSVVIVTHSAREKSVTAALKLIDALGAVGGRTVRIRIED